MTHLREEDLLLDFYGEASDEVRGHLSECPSCRALTEDLSAFLREIPVDAPPEPPAGWEDQVWSRLRWRLSEKPRRSWRPALAVAAALLVAFLAGVLSRDLAGPESATVIAESDETLAIDDEGRHRVFLLVLSDHLDRSERVLLELTRQPDLPFDVQSARAESLLSSNRLYRLTAEQSGDTRLASLLEELEPVLTELARSSEQGSPEMNTAIRRRIEDQELIFKIRVLGQQVRHDSTAAPVPNPST